MECVGHVQKRLGKKLRDLKKKTFVDDKRAVVRFLAAEGVKPSNVYRRMSAQYWSSCWIFPKPFQFQNDITIVMNYTNFLKLFLCSTI